MTKKYVARTILGSMEWNKYSKITHWGKFRKYVPNNHWGPHIRTYNRYRCVVCKASEHLWDEPVELPRYCRKCARELMHLWRGQFWDDDEEIPF